MKLLRMYRTAEFMPSCRAPCRVRLPVLGTNQTGIGRSARKSTSNGRSGKRPYRVKSVLRAPVPEYGMLTASALSAQTVDKTARSGVNATAPVRRTCAHARTVAELLLKVGVGAELLAAVEDLGGDELVVQEAAGQHRLDDVGPIQAVHAVGAHDRRLGALDRARRVLEKVAGTESRKNSKEDMSGVVC